MKLNKKQGALLITILSTIIIVLVILVGMGYLHSSIGMSVGGILLILSGIVQKIVMEKAEQGVRSKEKYGANKWSFVVGVIMIILAMINLLI